MASATEIEARNRYWFEHWREFTADVVVSVPVEHTTYLGAGFGHFFGAAPFPVRGQSIDRGRFQIREDGTVWVYGSRQTYAWDLEDTHVMYFPDGSGVEMRCANQPVIIIRGPVMAPIAGYIVESGGTIT